MLNVSDESYEAPKRMKQLLARVLLLIVILLTMSGLASAQSAGVSIPPSYTLNGVTHIWQQWNNCGPATMTMGLTYFGGSTDQTPAANWMKPNGEDKNVSPWQMIAYVNEVLDGTVRATMRFGGTLDQIKLLLANEFPVIIEAGYEPDNLGWMGHYLLMTGYDDAAQLFTTQDSYHGPNYTYTYQETDLYWRHFNRLYIVLYDIRREAELMALLGDDADEQQNVINALETARLEAIATPTDPFAWFNMGTSFVELEMYTEAATAYDQARNLGLPWRMMWYQFGPFEAYYHEGRHSDVIALAAANLNDGGGQYVEETFYYAALSRAAMGETDRALNNLAGAISFNPNFTPAIIARDELQGT